MVYVKWTIQCLSLGACVRAQLLHSCPTLSHPMDCSPPGSSVHGILQQEYWGGSPCPPPGILPTQGTNQRLLRLLPRQGDSLRLSHLGSRCHIVGVPTTVLTIIIPLKLSNTRCCTTGIRRPGSVLPLTRCMTLGKSPNTSESHVLICEMRSLYLIYPKILLRSKILVSWKRKTNTI